MPSAKRQLATRKIHPTQSSIPVVDILYRDDKEKIAHKYVFFRHEPTADKLEDWILDYYMEISDGYIPEGFTIAPRPFTARIYQRGNLLAEWIKPEQTSNVLQFPSPAPSAESPVTAKTRAGRGGIPAATPSTTTSKSSSGKSGEHNGRRPSPDTTAYSAVNDADDWSRRSGSGQPVA